MKRLPKPDSDSALATVSATPARLQPARRVVGGSGDFRLRRILVPVDFSTFSGRALRHALPLARKFDAEVMLLHVIETFPIDYMVGTESVPETSAQGRRRAKADLDRLAEKVSGASEVSRQSVVRVGKPWREITKAAVEMDVDLIVMSTHGRTGVERAYLGSTAERVVRHAACPVLIVRKR